MNAFPSRRAAAAGASYMQFKRGTSPMSQQHLLLRAIVAAAEDAGLDPSDIDGFVSWGDDSNEPVKLTQDLGTKEMRWSSAVWGGGGGGTCAAVEQAALAVASGQASAVVVFRALVQGNSGRLSEAVAANHFDLHYLMAGLTTPVQICALRARRMMEIDGVSHSAVQALIEVDYHHARNNPEATAYGNSFTLDDYHASRYISEPFRLYDCSRENDGAGAILIVSAEKAKDLRKPPVYIVGAAHGAPGRGRELQLNDDNFGTGGFELIAPRLFQRADMTIGDIDVVQVYENFVPNAVAALIDHGLCTAQEAGSVLTFENMISTGKLPVNTNGSNLGQGFVHGINTLVEGVRQLRGESANPVNDAKNSLVISGAPSTLVSSMILSNEG